MAYLNIDDLKLQRLFKLYEYTVSNRHSLSMVRFIASVILPVAPKQLASYDTRLKQLREAYPLRPIQVYPHVFKTFQFFVDDQLIALHAALLRPPKTINPIFQSNLCPEVFDD